jgi:hypothetical protein
VGIPAQTSGSMALSKISPGAMYRYLHHNKQQTTNSKQHHHHHHRAIYS